MTKRTLVMVGLGAMALVVASVLTLSSVEPTRAGYTMQTMEPVDAPLASKAENSCWFKVKNRSSRTDEVRQWEAVSSSGAKTERLGDLLIVTGAMQPGVREDHFYGCSLFQYTQGSPVVMTAKASPAPVRTDNLIPYGFSADGKKQQQ